MLCIFSERERERERERKRESATFIMRHARSVTMFHDIVCFDVVVVVVTFKCLYLSECCDSFFVPFITPTCLV